MNPAIKEAPLPKYIAIEGPIGVGKTTLANKIAKTFNYDSFLEQPAENPFLKNFYKNPKPISFSYSTILFIPKNATNPRSKTKKSF
jgi:deoxyadenosine/deoxycytidine kinase